MNSDEFRPIPTLGEIYFLNQTYPYKKAGKPSPRHRAGLHSHQDFLTVCLMLCSSRLFLFFGAQLMSFNGERPIFCFGGALGCITSLNPTSEIRASREGRLQCFCNRKLFMPAFQACNTRGPTIAKFGYWEMATTSSADTSTIAWQMRSTRCAMSAGFRPHRVCKKMSKDLPGSQLLRPPTD